MWRQTLAMVAVVVVLAASAASAAPGQLTGEGEVRVVWADGDSGLVVTSRPDGSDQRGFYAGGAPSPAPNGSAIAVVAPGRSRLLVVPTDDGAAVTVFDGTEMAGRVFSVAWSPDSSRLAFEVETPPEGDEDAHAGNRVDVWMVNVDGSGARNLTPSTTAYEWDPVWSPDGTEVLFTRHPNPAGLDLEILDDLGAQELWLVDVDTGRQRQVTHDPNVAIATRTAGWSTDGRSVVAIGHDVVGPELEDLGTISAWQVDVATGAATPVVAGDGEVDAILLDVSSKGELLYRIRDEAGSVVWITDEDGSNSRRLDPRGEGANGVFEAEFSPDGTQVVMLAFENSQFHVVLANTANGAQVALASRPRLGSVGWVTSPVTRTAARQLLAAPSIGDPLPSESKSWDGISADLNGDNKADLVLTRHHSNNAYLKNDTPDEHWLVGDEADEKCNEPDPDPCTYPFVDMEDGVWLRKASTSAPWALDDFELAFKFGTTSAPFYRDRHGCAVGNLDGETLSSEPFANDIVCATGAGSGFTKGKPFEVYIGAVSGATVTYSNETEFEDEYGQPPVGWGFDSRCDYCRGRAIVLTDYDADDDDDVVVIVKEDLDTWDHDGDGGTPEVYKSTSRVLENDGSELVWDHGSNFDRAKVAGHCFDTLNLYPANDSRLDMVTCDYDGNVTVWRANASAGDLTDNTSFHLTGTAPTWDVVGASDDYIVGSNNNAGIEVWGRKEGTNQQYEWKFDVDAGTSTDEIDGYVAVIEVVEKWAYVTVRGSGDVTSLLDTCGSDGNHSQSFDYKASVIVRLDNGHVYPMPLVEQGCPGRAVEYGQNWFLTLNGWTRTLGPVEFQRYDTE